MVMPLVILAAAWVLALGCVLALCRGARRGDEMLARERAEARRRELAAGVVVLDASGPLSAADLRPERDPSDTRPLLLSGAAAR